MEGRIIELAQTRQSREANLWLGQPVGLGQPLDRADVLEKLDDLPHVEACPDYPCAAPRVVAAEHGRAARFRNVAVAVAGDAVPHLFSHTPDGVPVSDTLQTCIE